jgi:NAD(P)H-dependent flavin oxidoreductase YrpB (nitropropane dioxygenase family)
MLVWTGVLRLVVITEEMKLLLYLIPMVKEQIEFLIAAGGIANGRGMLAAMVLGADAVQVGSRFAASMESSAHENFKKTIIETKEIPNLH